MNILLKLLITIIYRLETIGLGSLVRSGIYLFLAFVFRYRKKVIDRNLAILFPNAKPVELSKYKKNYYRHLADLIVETLWCYRATRIELNSKVHLKNPELFDQIFLSGENITILISHIGNWELFCQWAGMFTPRFKVPILYTPIKNTQLNDLMLNLRQRTGNTLVSTKSTLELFRLQKSKPAAINLFAIDQNPGDPYNQHWLTFFRHEVPVISGPEKFVKSVSQKAYFLYVTKTYRYEIEVIELPYDVSKPFDLTEKQFQILEKNVVEDPSLWLLSHNRFKYRKRN